MIKETDRVGEPSGPEHPVELGISIIEDLTSSRNTGFTYIFKNRQPGHTNETTYQSMIKTPDGTIWRAIRITNECGGGIVTNHYEFATNSTWESGARRIIFDPNHNNLIDETIIVEDNGEIKINKEDIFRTGNSEYINDLLEILGLNHPQLVDKSTEDIIFTRPEVYQMYNAKIPDFKYVGELQKQVRAKKTFLGILKLLKQE